MGLLIAATVVMVAGHIVPSVPVVRAGLIARLGRRPFLAAHSALSLAVLGLPYLNDLAGVSITMSIWQNPWFWGSFLGVFVVGVLLSSLYPAFVLSAFKPITVLKGRQGTAFSKNWLRRVLVVFQFAASMALLSASTMAPKLAARLTCSSHMDPELSTSQSMSSLGRSARSICSVWPTRTNESKVCSG